MSTRGIPIAGALVAFATILGTAATAAPNRQIIFDPAYLQPQRLIAVEGGRRLNLYCVGSGSPTVVFDSGLGEGMIAWALVQPQVAQRTRACSYDRAGLGFSDPTPATRQARTWYEICARF